MKKNVDNEVLTPEEYKAAVISKMKYYGATEKDIALVTDEMIKNKMQLRVDPDVLAWALMQ